MLKVDLVKIKCTQTLNELMEKIVELFGIKEKRDNIRLRQYKPNTDMMLQSYTGREHFTLESLKIGHLTNLCIEVKREDQIFEDFGNKFLKLLYHKFLII